MSAHTIRIDPPLTLADTHDGPELRTIELIHVRGDDGAFPSGLWTANAIGPVGGGVNYYPHFIRDELQQVVDHYDRTFTGFIEVRNSSPGQSPVSRYVVVDRRVETVAPRLVWSGEDDKLLADARALAILCRDVLKELPHDLAGILDVEWEELPDWFTDDDQGREMWGGDDA